MLMDITKAKELALEIAGLLTALDNNLISEESAENANRLVEEKVNQLAQLFAIETDADIIIDEMLANAESEVIEQEETEENVTEEPSVEYTEETPVEEELPIEEELPVIEGLHVAEESPVEEETSSDDASPVQEELTIEEESPVEECTAEIEIPLHDEIAEEDILETPEIDEIEEETVADDETTDSPVTDLNESVFMRTKVGSISKAFTINDRFRFKRELFGNSDPELSNALDLINVMRSIDEAEDYFYNELGWDAENEDVKDFMRIVRAYFLNRQ